MLILSIELVGLSTILIALKPTGLPACLEEAQLMKNFIYHPASIKRSIYLLELCHNGIKLLVLQKRSTSFSSIELVWKIIDKNNLNIEHRKCSVSSTSFSIYTCSVYPRRLAENYKTLDGFVSLGKLSEKAKKRAAESTISRLPLWKVTYKMLPLLPKMQGPFG